MNRIILIGNGFDLAHGLKTSYNDFILWYLKKCFIESNEKGIYDDTLIEVRRHRRSQTMPSYPNDVEAFVEDSYKQSFNNIIDRINVTFSGDSSRNNNKPFTVKLKSKLLDILLSNCSYTKWVDIESEFYKQLKNTLNDNNNVDYKESRLRELNESLAYIIIQLEIYLNTLAKPNMIEDYITILLDRIKSEDIHDLPDYETTEPENSLVLDFNYTSTIKPYLQWFDDNQGHPRPILNHIHGQLNSEANPLVFGFGDELDDAYLRMEREDAKGYFNYIKSFWYFRTRNYRDLVQFLEAKPYQVCILGHSCGLSDRTMLHMLFERSNCKSIKVYYHGDKNNNNYTSITHEISRHFKNKEAMRYKIVSLVNSSAMPQG